MAFKVGDKVVLTEKAKQQFKTIIGNDPYGGWNKNFEQMVYDGTPEIVTGIAGTQVWLCDGKFYVDINDITIESYNPDTAKPPEVVAVGEKLISTEWTDKHYDFSYQLTEKDIESGFVKVDPYFVAKQWEIGSKDDSGALWHCFKTIARFGEKNSKEREIRALYAQIKRLADLEGIEL